MEEDDEATGNQAYRSGARMLVRGKGSALIMAADDCQAFEILYQRL